MNHRELEEREVIERYVQGRLEGEEASAFEAHLLECSECFEKVRWSEDLGRALRAAAAEDLARAAGRAGILAWLTRTAGGRAAAWALGLALVATPTALWVREHARVHELAAPRVNVPVFELGATRDGMVNRVSLGSSAEWIVLVLSLPTVEDESYRAVLRRGDGQELWRGDGLVPDAGDRLVVSFPSTRLEPGGYELEVAGSGEKASAHEETFRFEVGR